MADCPLAAFEHDRYRDLATARVVATTALKSAPLWMVERHGRLHVHSVADAWTISRIRCSPRLRIAPSRSRGAVTGDR